MFFASKDIYFSIEVSLLFHVCSKPFQGIIFEESPCRSFLKNWIVPQTSVARRGSYLLSTELPLDWRNARRRQLALTCLDLPSPAPNSLDFRNARRRSLA